MLSSLSFSLVPSRSNAMAPAHHVRAVPHEANLASIACTSKIHFPLSLRTRGHLKISHADTRGIIPPPKTELRRYPIQNSWKPELLSWKTPCPRPARNPRRPRLSCARPALRLRRAGPVPVPVLVCSIALKTRKMRVSRIWPRTLKVCRSRMTGAFPSMARPACSSFPGVLCRSRRGLLPSWLWGLEPGRNG